MPVPVAVFDLDGTLVDTAPDLLASLDIVLGAAGHAPVPRDLGRAMIGRGAKAMIASGLEYHRVAFSDGELDAMHAHFLQHYSANIAVGSRPFPGLLEALDELDEAGVLLAVCTNKLEALARHLLSELGMERRFAAVVGPDTLGVKKPDPQHILGTIARVGGSPEAAVMVGDSTLDVAAARAAGVPVIAVDFGYTEMPVGDLGADHIISHYDALWEACAPWLGLPVPLRAARPRFA